MAPTSATSSNGHHTNGASNGSATSHMASSHVASSNGARSVLPGAARRATIGDIAAFLNAELVGNAETPVTGVAGIESAEPGAILFVENERLLKAALDSSAAAIIAPSSVAAKVRRAERRGGKPAVLTGNPRLAFAKVMEYFQPLLKPEPGIHPTAIIEPDAHIGEGVTIREYCYVGHFAHIGDGAVIYPHCVIGDGAQISAETILYPSVVINHHVHVGKRVRIHSGSVLGGDGFGYVMDGGKHHKMPQLGTVIIEDDVEIGANVCIDRATIGATRVGEGTKIDNLVQIAHNCQIGRNCILCGQVGLSGSVIVEDNVVMAGQAGLADHVKIGKGAILGAKAGIMSNVPSGDFVMGAPAVTHRDALRIEASTRKLPEAMRTLRQLERQVQELQAQVEGLKESR
ncbi:MAG TPA: UDP-3-O-(3-hydroxymyristoyl)glucosamine N-acyltransferase [Abditibacteriaceae bacterium]|jgi:UDP-3-O-[3-hydroxymyristoyl] glucosamine N-acyltransferase